jgi:polyisoprenoid-binding protein YceI
MTTTRFAAATLFALLTSATAAAQETARVTVAPESKLWIDGTSNVHAWSCKAEKLEATVDLDAGAAAQLATAAPKTLKRVEVKIPVKSLKCGHDGMDKNLYKALNADGTSDITYILATFEAAPGEAKDTFTLHTVGTLNIAGKENKITMDVEATRMPDGTVKAKGVVPVKMTDYGVKPPKAMFGAIKTGEDVKVNFELIVSGKVIATALSGKP